ncbi:MAG: Gfo/Idh/MocA family oxidoreductase [Sedimentisphaerales bacterium]|nr:Gfo/Idh/MocA family oxidoreductase [Sedimentisphaerales bacterium]
MKRFSFHNTKRIPGATEISTRRRFLSSGGLLAGSVLTGINLGGVHAAEDNTIRLALVGCGGRGSGAAANALSSSTGPTRLVAMADIFEDRLARSYKALSEQFSDQVDVPAERRFQGFDAYRKAVDAVGPGGVMIQATHSIFRPVHVAYAVERGVHVFMEKSFAPDPAGTRRILEIADQAKYKNLKIGCGLMCRHSSARQAMIEKIREGALGQIVLIRAYRMDGGIRLEPFPGNQSELLWQLRRPYAFLWVSSAQFIEWMIHQIDECCWIKDAWPVSAHGLGGREPRSTDCAQNMHTYCVEFTYPDGTKAQINGRAMPNTYGDFATYVHGAGTAGQFSGNVHAPTVSIFKDQRCEKDNISWQPEREQISPYQVEWNVLLDAIRHDKPHNEAHRAAYTNYASIMARAAVHEQRIITWDEVTGSDFSFFTGAAGLTAESPAPVKADAEGRYPVPIPGAWKEI